jgi:hypothetical protein
VTVELVALDRIEGLEVGGIRAREDDAEAAAHHRGLALLAEKADAFQRHRLRGAYRALRVEGPHQIPDPEVAQLRRQPSGVAGALSWQLGQRAA